jgi:hypothetical protein
MNTIAVTAAHRPILFLRVNGLFTFSFLKHRNKYIAQGIIMTHTETISPINTLWSADLNHISLMVPEVITCSPKSGGTARNRVRSGSTYTGKARRARPAKRDIVARVSTDRGARAILLRRYMRKLSHILINGIIHNDEYTHIPFDAPLIRHMSQMQQSVRSATSINLENLECFIQ